MPSGVHLFVSRPRSVTYIASVSFLHSTARRGLLCALLNPLTLYSGRDMLQTLLVNAEDVTPYIVVKFTDISEKNCVHFQEAVS